jgi:hypothetical protein
MYVPHEIVNLKAHPAFNEKWLHDRICEDPSILGLGDVRVLDRERAVTPSGRLDLLLFDEDNNCRYEVEIMLGATDPSHIIRTIEYWDVERRRYPGYEHVAVLIAEDVTTRFLNVMSLLSGSIPFVAVQLNALQVGDKITLSFVRVLDQTELRIDDTDDDDAGGVPVDRADWDQKSPPELMKICDEGLRIVNAVTTSMHELNYMRNYIGLRCNGVVDNFVAFSPKKTKNFVHIWLHITDAGKWKDQFEQAGLPALSRHRRRLKLTVSPAEFEKHEKLIREVIQSAAKESEG